MGGGGLCLFVCFVWLVLFLSDFFRGGGGWGGEGLKSRPVNRL